MEHIAHGITPLPICHISPRHMRIIISIIVLGLLLTGCSQSPTGYNQALLRAEGLVESRPDSALNILDSISKSSLQSESDNALYALLMVQARVKNRIDDGNDSLINAAVDYYAATDDSHRTMLAYYNRGFLQLLTDSLSQAVSSLLPALDIAEETGNNFYASLASRALSSAFNQSGNSPEELHYAKRAYEYINMTGRQPYADWAIHELAGAYQDNQQRDTALTLFHQLLDTLKQRPDSLLSANVYRNISKSLIADGRQLEALPYLTQLCSSEYVKKPDFGLLGLCLVKKGDITGAKAMLAKTDSVSGLTNWLRYTIYKATGDKDMAFEALADMQDDSEKDIRKMLAQRATLTALQHHEQQKKTAREEAKLERMHTLTAILISCIILIIAIGIIVYMRVRHRTEEVRNEHIAQRLQHILSLRKLEQEAALQSEAMMKNMLQQTRDENSDMRLETSRLRHALEDAESKVRELDDDNKRIRHYQQMMYQQAMEYNKTLNRICSISCCVTPDRFTTTTQIVGWLDGLIKEITKSSKKFEELETIANMTYDNVMVQLRATMPKFKEEDFRLYLLSIFGFSPSAITKLMKADSTQLIYARKKRLRVKLSKSDNPLCKKFLQLLEDKGNIDF